MQAILRRIEALEKENRRTKRLGVSAVVIAATLGAIAATGPVPDVIKAHEIDVVDGTGDVRIRLWVQKEGIASVGVFDTKGVIGAVISWDNFLGPHIDLGYHKAPNLPSGLPHGSMVPDITIGDQPLLGPVIMLSRGGSLGPSVNLGVTPSGQPNIVLADSKGNDRAAISLSANGAPRIDLTDPEGYSLDLGSTNTVTTRTGETEQTSAASIVMFGNDEKRKVIWKAP
jgi:hypothetical protein